MAKPKKKLQWTFYHLAVFVLTFVSYASFHATRKTFSNVKADIQATWTPTSHNGSYNGTFNHTDPDYIWNNHTFFANDRAAELYLGTLDAVFLISYAVGLYVSGIVGDRFDMRKVLSFGMCMSAITVFMFGTLTEWLKLYNIYWYTGFWILNGLLQSTGWPTVVAVMGNWFGKSSRGLVLGAWSACASVGNIIGAGFVAAMLQYGYEYTFLLSSSVLFGMGIVVFFGLIPSPRDVGLPEPEEDDVEEDVDPTQEPLLSNSRNEETVDGRPKAIGFFQAVLLPGVIMYSLCYACLKLVNYAFFFWLPFYLSENFNWSDSVADEISIWYDVGGLVAGILGGIVTDYFHKRSPTVVFLLLLAFPALYIYSGSPKDKLINSVLLAVTGFFIGGPANLISAAISADLGRQGPVKGNNEALATVTGIVDGTGSVGAAIGQLVVPVIQENLNWHWVFYFFILMTFLTILCITPILYKDITSSRIYIIIIAKIFKSQQHLQQVGNYQPHVDS